MLCASLIPNCERPLPLFSFPSPRGPQPVTYSMFITHLGLCLRRIGLNPSLYSGHSFRRDGASFALQCGIPAEWIIMQGDWSSDSYQRYLDPSFEHRVQLARAMGNSFLRSSNKVWLGRGCFAGSTCIFFLLASRWRSHDYSICLHVDYCVIFVCICHSYSTFYLGLGLWRSFAL